MIYKKMKNKFKITIFSLSLMFSLSFANNAHAFISWPDLVGFTYKQGLEEVMKMIHGVILGALKQAAVQTINDTVNNLVAGTTASGSMFITDWEEYLYRGPLRENQLYMNDFFTLATRGQASGMNYRSNCGKDYANYLIDNAGGGNRYAAEFPSMNLQEYVCDASDMFENATWMAFDAFTSNTLNDPLGFALTAEGVKQADLERRQKEAEDRALAYQGYKAQTQGGMVVTPGSTIKDVVANAKDVPNKVIASAENIPEVISSVVTGIVTNTIQQGIGNARGNIQREVDNKICDFSKGIRNNLDIIGPEGNFSSPSYSSGLSSSSQYRGMNCNIR